MLQKFNQIKEWVRAHEKELFIGLLVILSSTLAYGLGRLTKLEANQAPVTITPTSSSTVQTIQLVDEVSSDNRLVASKKGTKYYFPWCGSSKTIKAENRIYFLTATAAETAGYTRAGNCQPKP
jgi:hypothetical protein